MLVLSRKKGQGLVIGNGIEVVIIAVRGKQVKLGIAAPSEIGVRRKEVMVASENPTGSGGQISLRPRSDAGAIVHSR